MFKYQLPQSNIIYNNQLAWIVLTYKVFWLFNECLMQKI